MSSVPLSSSAELKPDSEQLFVPGRIAAFGVSVLARPLDKDALQEWALLYQSQVELPFYLHPDWIRAIAGCLFQQTLLAVSVYADDGQASESKPANPRMMLLLHSPEKANQKNRFTLGAPVHDHLTLGDVLIADGVESQGMQSAIAAVLEYCDISRLVFHNLPENSPLQRSIKADTNVAGKGHAPVWVCSHARDSAYFDLCDGSSVPSGKLKRNLKRLRGKLEKEGKVESRSYRGSDALQAFDVFMDVEASGWKGAEGTGSSIQADPQLSQFYQTMLQPEFDGMIPEIHHLCLDDEVIAVQYALCTGTTQYILKISYNESYGYYSPGSLLLEEVIEQARAAGVERLSLVTSPVWAERWHPQVVPVSRIVAHRSSVLAVGERTVSRIRKRVKRASLIRLSIANKVSGIAASKVSKKPQ